MSVPVLSWSLIACRSVPRDTKLSRSGEPAASVRRIALPQKRECVPPIAHSQSPLRFPARQTRPLEPILFPKLRIYFADFPYLHCSMGQRLLTLETCCGYEYERTRKSIFPPSFQGPWATHRTPHEVRSFTDRETISPGKQIPWSLGR